MKKGFYLRGELKILMLRESNVGLLRGKQARYLLGHYLLGFKGDF